jgi:hypothetical protein
LGVISTIGAQLIFNTANAVLSANKFVRTINMTGSSMTVLQKEATKSGVTVDQFIRAMNSAKRGDGPTSLQRNVKLATAAVNTLLRTVREGRAVYDTFFGSLSRPIPTHHVTSFANTVKAAFKPDTYSGLATFLSGLAIASTTEAMASGTMDMGSGVSGLIKKWIVLAGTMEGARTTFDAILGDSKKSEELLERISKYSAKTPFTRLDVIDASKRLLTISGTDLAANERLFKMSGNIAALRPGMGAADAARGIVQATMGEFEILKSTFGLVLNAKMFKDFGTPGGKEYSKAVLKEIERQFTNKTGGRDLVGALGETLFGKASTLQDDLEMIGEIFGSEIVRIFGMKEGIQGAIDFFDQLHDALKFLTEPLKEGSFDLIKDVDKNVLDVAIRIKTALTFIEDKWREFSPKIRPFVKDFLSMLFDLKGKVFAFFVGFQTVSSIGGALILPVLAGLFGVIGMLSTALVTIAAVGLPGVIVGLLLFSSLIAPIAALTMEMTVAVIALVVAFLEFRRENETTLEAFKRLGVSVWSALMRAKDAFFAFSGGFGEAFGPLFWAALNDIRVGVAGVIGPITHFVTIMMQLFEAMGLGSDSMMLFAGAGRALGFVLGSILRIAAFAVWGALSALGRLLSVLTNVVIAMTSDFYRMGKAFIDFVNGTASGKATLETIMRGVADVMLTPFRTFFLAISTIVGDGLNILSEKIRPFNTKLADDVKGMADSVRSMGTTVNEGFLKNDRLFQSQTRITVDGTVKLGVPVEVKIDGQKVAEAQVLAEVRAKNAGRGGDPVSPEELGFVIEGGTKIRPVLPNEVAKDF